MKNSGPDFEERFITSQNKQKTAIELIPENENYLKQKIEELKYTDYDIINLPHLTTRKNGKTFLSPEKMVKIKNLIPENKDLILHLRTQDSKNVGEVINRITELLKNKIKLLLITGDIYTKNNELITTGKVLKNILDCQQGGFSPLNINSSDISVSADLYLEKWGRFDNKVEFLKQNTKSKIFTQPVFAYENIEDIEKNIINFGLNHNKENIFAGITWFSNSRQRDYWKNINNVPEKFLPGNGKYSDKLIKETSLARATEIYKELKNRGFSNYIMLMRESIKDILKIQNKSENILY